MQSPFFASRPWFARQLRKNQTSSRSNENTFQEFAASETYAARPESRECRIPLVGPMPGFFRVPRVWQPFAKIVIAIPISQTIDIAPKSLLLNQPAIVPLGITVTLPFSVILMTIMLRWQPMAFLAHRLPSLPKRLGSIMGRFGMRGSTTTGRPTCWKHDGDCLLRVLKHRCFRRLSTFNQFSVKTRPFWDSHPQPVLHTTTTTY